jgi:DNA helicase-2/ATP-dependent DNA helicase PcrA
MNLTNSSTRIDAIIDKLNEPQKEAVLHTEGPLVVFAGAGSGKTRVISARIAILLERGFHPRSILAMTFTNKAAQEMRERVRLWSSQGDFVPIGTFHSLCARWLREFASEIGFTSGFSIFDDNDSKSTVKKIMEEFRIKDDKTSPGDYLSAIGKAKTLAWLPDEASKNERFFPPLGVSVYKRYQEILASCNAMDFDDLLMNMLLLLRKHENIRKIMQDRYQHILIDEYQDTNTTQSELVDLLLNTKKNLLVVGDDDQSIYSWRGADPNNILEFRSRYPKAKIIRLEQNYRCTKNIVGAAAALIAHNKKRAEKTLWTDNKEGAFLSFRQEYDALQEAIWLSDQIKIEQFTYHYENVAVFYRINAQSRQIEDALRKQNIPYRIYGALRFYDRAEIKDILGYFRLIANPRDDIAFRRIVNIPARGIGEKSLEVLEQKSLEEHIPLLEALNLLIQHHARISPRMVSFFSIIQELKKLSEQGALSELLQAFLKATDYLGYVQKKYPDSFTDRIANIHELGTALTDYEQANPESKLVDWLNEISLSSSVNETEQGISLMTFHSAKGLEFPRVYIVGVEDGLVPHSHSMDNPEGLEEERRLFYVGLTRAKEKISLVTSQKRRIFTHDMVNPPSRFLNEIPLEFFDAPSKKLLKAEPVNPDAKLSTVLHSAYGKGQVKKLEYEWGIAKAIVDFRDFGIRKVNITQLRPLNEYKTHR